MLLIKSSALDIKRDDEIEAERLFYYYKLTMGINLYKLLSHRSFIKILYNKDYLYN